MQNEMGCNFVYSHCWYGRGSKDWDYYNCTTCGQQVMVSEDVNPSYCVHPDVVKAAEEKRKQDDDKKLLRKLLDTYGYPTDESP